LLPNIVTVLTQNALNENMVVAADKSSRFININTYNEISQEGVFASFPFAISNQFISTVPSS